MNVKQKQSGWRKQHFLCLTLAFVLCSMSSFAQQVKGLITDAKTGEPLIGVSVKLKGDKETGTISDLDGNYSLSVPDAQAATLVFSYIGYVEQILAVNGQKTLNVAMQEDVETLDEVVVIGYGTMRKRDLTGAMTRVKSEDMNAMTVPNPIQALH